MPSDIPSIRLVRPVSAGTVPPGAAVDPRGQDAANADRPAHAPTILNPALRRFWHRAAGAEATPRTVQQKIVQQGIFWVFLLGILVAAALFFDRGITEVQSPQRRLGPVPTAPVPSRPAAAELPALPVVVVRPEVAYGYGSGAVREAERIARRYGVVSGYAVACGRQLRTWMGTVSAALAVDIAERMPMFEPDSKVTAWMQDYIRAQFRNGLLIAERNLITQGKDAVCADLPLSPDYAGAVRLVREAPFGLQ